MEGSRPVMCGIEVIKRETVLELLEFRGKRPPSQLAPTVGRGREVGRAEAREGGVERRGGEGAR